MVGHVLRHDEKLHHTIIEGAIEERKPPGRPINSYLSQLKKDAGIAGLKRLAEYHKKLRTKLNVVRSF